MTNSEAAERFDGHCKGAKIEKLFWIAGSIENSDFEELLDEMEPSDFEECFGFSKPDREDIVHDLMLTEKYGVLAEIHLPHSDNFRFKDGKVVSWQSHQGISRVEYVYSEGLAGLMDKIQDAANSFFHECVIKEQSLKSK